MLKNISKKSIFIVVLVFSTKSYSGAGERLSVDIDCAKLKTSSTSANIKVIDSLIVDHYFANEEAIKKISKNPIIIKNKFYAAYKLCMSLNNGFGVNDISEYGMVKLFAKTIFPELGISYTFIKNALPTTSIKPNINIKFHENGCKIFGEYDFAICAKSETLVAIDEHYERYKMKNNIDAESITKTIDYYVAEIEIQNDKIQSFFDRKKFLYCGVVTWGECSFKRRPSSSYDIQLNKKNMRITLLKVNANMEMEFKISTTR